LDAIECRDAVVTKREDGSYVEAQWPKAEFVIGNPPFLGNKKMIEGIGEYYVQSLRGIYENRISGGVDLVVYWFAKAWDAVESDRTSRAGLVATNSIRSGASREMLKKIVEHGRIFDAWEDEEWTIEGAQVRVSMVCFSKDVSETAHLNGAPVAKIHSNLSAASFDVTAAKQLIENSKTSFVGVILNGEFEVEPAQAREWLLAPTNVNGRSNSDVLRPTFNGSDFNGERNEKWVVDFGVELSEAAAAQYELPFQYISSHVKPYRERRRQDGTFAVRADSERKIWWRHARARPAMRKALRQLSRYIATPMVSSYRTFDFLDHSYLPDQKLVVFSRDDWTFFGVLHCKFHESWTVRTCAWIGAGNDITYSNQAVFLTYPFPEGLTPDMAAEEYAHDPRAITIGNAAQRLDKLRNNWLKPKDLIDIIPEVVSGYPDRILPKNEKAAAEMKKRTLADLYNHRPQWLADAHRDLDAAVAVAYGWPSDISEENALTKLLELNLERAGHGMASADV
jgi:type II restriction/modification system DNA methylase subunit YeeA